MNRSLLTNIAALGLIFACSAQAEIIVGDVADGEINTSDNIEATGRQWSIAGTRGGNPNAFKNSVYVFDVSTMPTGAGLATVSLNATFRERWNEAELPTDFATDAYFVGFSSTAALNDDAPTDLVFVDSDSGPGIKIADDVVVKGDATPDNTAFELGLGDAALLAALQGRATDGSQDFAYFRLNHDVSLDGVAARNFFGFAWYHADSPIEEQRPFLEFTVPEPGSLGLAALGLMAMACRRRCS